MALPRPFASPQRRRLEHDVPAPSPRRARVLLELPDGVDRWAYERLFRSAGYDVSTCSGPTTDRCCPLLEDGVCPLVEAASVVVASAQLGDVEPILAAHRERGLPVVVEATRSRARALHPCAATVIEAPAGAGVALDSVARLLRSPN